RSNRDLGGQPEARTGQSQGNINFEPAVERARRTLDGPNGPCRLKLKCRDVRRDAANRLIGGRSEELEDLPPQTGGPKVSFVDAMKEPQLVAPTTHGHVEPLLVAGACQGCVRKVG